MISVYVFQSTHPRGVRPTTRLWNFRLNRFNPRTHEGCDPAILLTNSSRRVSIHAPTRGATGKNLIRRPRSEFQSTHPRGVRLYIRRRTIYRSSFNPRTHEGCDTSERHSKHLPQGFNPRTHEGCDYVRCVRTGVRPCFNPRTHEGCDYRCVSYFHL